jgi:hypothetical protein
VNVLNAAANASTLINTRLSISFSHEDATLGTDDNMAFQATTQVFDGSGRLVPARLTATFGVPKYIYNKVYIGDVITFSATPSIAACTEQTTPFQSLTSDFQSSLHAPNLIESDLSGLHSQPNPVNLFAMSSQEHVPFSELPSFNHRFQTFDRSRRKELARRRQDPHVEQFLQQQDTRHKKYLFSLLHRFKKQTKSSIHKLRLLSAVITAPLGGDTVPDYDLTPTRMADYQNSTSYVDRMINPLLDKFKVNESYMVEQSRLNTDFALAAQQALQAVLFAQNLTSNALPDVDRSFNLTIEMQQEINKYLSSINQTTQQAISILQDASANATAQLDALEASVSSTTYHTLVETQVYQGNVARLKAAADAMLNAVSYLRQMADGDLQTVKLLLNALDQYRLDKPRNRLESQSIADMTMFLEEQGLIPFVSTVIPVVHPLGFVPTPPNTPPYFLVLTLVYTFKAFPGNDVQSALYPDPDVPADSVASLPLDAQNTYNNLMLAASQSAIANTFVGLRSLAFQCNRDFLLENRDMFITAYNFINMIGPAGCTPNVNCTCWVVVHSERCATARPLGYNDSSTVISSLSQVSGLCADNTDLQTWFNPVTNTGSDTSPTQLSASYNLTSSSDFLQVLRKLCQIRLVGAVDPNDPFTNPGFFLLHTSSFEISPTQLGSFLHVPNDPSLCSTNHIEMEVESVLHNRTTLVYAAFLHIRYAAGLLFQKSSAEDEVAKYGSGSPLSTSYDQHPYHTYMANYARLTWEQVDNITSGAGAANEVDGHLPHDLDCEVATMLFTGRDTYPVFRKTLSRITQEVTVSLTYTDENGMDQTTTYTTDKVRRVDVPTNPLPDSFLQVGPDDCIWNLCNDYSSTLVLSNFVLDFPLSGGGVLIPDRNEDTRRNTALYVMQFAPDLIEDPDHPGQMVPPWAPDSNYIFPKPVMTLDMWLKQNNRSKFEPRYATVSPSDWKRHLISDPLTGYQRCDSIEVSNSPHGEGLMCALLRQTRQLLPPDLGDLLDQQRQSVYAPIEWKSIVEIDVRGIDLQLNPPLRLVCPDPNLVKIDTSSSTSAASGGSMATFQYKNTHSYPVLGLVLIFASNDPKASRTPKFNASTYGLASNQYWVNATDNPSLVLSNVSCTRVLAHLSFGYERNSLPLPLPTTCNNQNLAVRFYSVDVTGFVPSALLNPTLLVHPTQQQLLAMYQNATATATLVKNRVQLCWQHLSLNLTDVYVRQKNLFYNGDVRTASTGLVNATSQSLLGTQVTDLRQYTLSSISANAAAASNSVSNIFSRTIQTATLQSFMKSLLLFNASASTWLDSLQAILVANNANATVYNQSSNLTSLLDQFQSLWVSVQRHQQLSDTGPIDMSTSISALKNTASSIGADLQDQIEQVRALKEQAATYSKLIKNYIDNLNLTKLAERLQIINETTQQMVADTLFLEQIHNHSISENLTSIDAILAPGGGTPEFTSLVYENAAEGNTMFNRVLSFIGDEVTRFAGDALDIAHNVVDLIKLVSTPDPNCFLKVLCPLANGFRTAVIVVVSVLGAGAVGFVIYQVVKSTQAAQQSHEKAQAMQALASSVSGAGGGGGGGGGASAAAVKAVGASQSMGRKARPIRTQASSLDSKRSRTRSRTASKPGPTRTKKAQGAHYASVPQTET